jgi:hypothetical protein
MSRERYVRCTKGSCSVLEGAYYRLNADDSITGTGIKYDDPSREISGLATFELIDNTKVTHVICTQSSNCGTFKSGIIYMVNDLDRPIKEPGLNNLTTSKWDSSDRYIGPKGCYAQFLPFTVADKEDKIASRLGGTKEPTNVLNMGGLPKGSSKAIAFISSIVTLK